MRRAIFGNPCTSDIPWWIPDDLVEVVDVDVVQIAGLAQVIFHHFAHPLPPGIAAGPFDQAFGTSPDLAQLTSPEPRGAHTGARSCKRPPWGD